MLVKPLKPSVETTIDVPAHIEIAESIGALKHKVESEAQAHQMALEEFESNIMLCEDRICQSNALTSLKQLAEVTEAPLFVQPRTYLVWSG